MGFKVIEDPEQLRALGEAGLLWFYWKSLSEWRPSINVPTWWRQVAPSEVKKLLARRVYGLLLED